MTDQTNSSEQMRIALREAIAASLGEAMDCIRVWSAWGVGTMGPDDFPLVAEDDGRVEEIVDAVLAVIESQVTTPVDENVIRNTARYLRLRENWIDCNELGLHGRLSVVDAVVDKHLSQAPQPAQDAVERDHWNPNDAQAGVIRDVAMEEIAYRPQPVVDVGILMQDRTQCQNAGACGCKAPCDAPVPAVPAGFRLMPIEPNEDMEIAGMEESVLGRPSIDDPAYVLSIYKAMTDAAPQSTAPQVQLSKPHPWAAFLSARADVIDWMSVDHNFAEIASTLSMDQQQVSLIYMMRKAK